MKNHKKIGIKKPVPSSSKTDSYKEMPSEKKMPRGKKKMGKC